MGTVAAVAAALSAVIGLVLYLYKRHDNPAAMRRRSDEAKKDDLDGLDRALGEYDAQTLTRMFSELDDRAEPYRVRGEDGDSTGGPGDKAPA